MGKVTGFLDYERRDPEMQPVTVRKKNFSEFIKPLSQKKISEQAARCMDCGIPFCHVGCPLGNIIPDFNHYLYTGNHERAYEILRSTNNFPSITGRVCPAPCESACVLGINNTPVAIKGIERFLGDEALRQGWDKPPSPNQARSRATGGNASDEQGVTAGHTPAAKLDGVPRVSGIASRVASRIASRIAIVGSGPAGLAAADQLNEAGHSVTVYERDDRIGGLLMYGIPNFKLAKSLVEKEVARLRDAGIRFIVNQAIGANSSISLDDLRKDYDAVVLAIGSTVPRSLPIKGHDANGILFAMDFLTDATKSVLDKKHKRQYTAKDKNVLVIGGGDTGSDCIGTSFRQGAKRVTQIEILPKPPAQRDESMPWPQYDRIFRVSSSQAEGAHREFSILTKEFLTNAKNDVTGIDYANVRFEKGELIEASGKPRKIKADLVLLAMGFVHPDLDFLEGKSISGPAPENTQTPPAEEATLRTNKRGLLYTDDTTPYQTNLENVFVAGDARRGQSLVVWAISEGRECARAVDTFLTQRESSLPAKNASPSTAMPFNGAAQAEVYEIF